MDYSRSTFVGRVKGKPHIVAVEGGKKHAFLTLVVNKRVLGANKQYVDQPTEIPLFADTKAELIEQYVVPGHELLVNCQYNAWTDDKGILQHTFVVQSVTFGFKPKQDGATGYSKSAPPL